ncbi:hypothetical protein [Paenibacillus solani]|uniref:hypothetical protein n=1 Tax=Paenibacillus solani TaxID=1705565 RepID=UPI003D2DD5E7
MELLKYLNIPELTTIVTIVFMIVIGIHFIKMSEPEKLMESGRLKTLRMLINEIILFVIVTIVLTYVHQVGIINPALMLINLFCLLFSTILAFSYSDFKHNRFQIAVNKVVIRFLGQRFYKYFVYLLILGHSFLVIWFYKQSISMLIDNLNTYYKLNQTDPVLILIEATQKNKLNIYLYLGFAFFMFFLLRKAYMHPINKITNGIFQTKHRKNIRLSSGEQIKNVYVFQSADNKFIIASVDEVLSSSVKHYHINKDKIDYIEVASNSWDKIIK